MTRAGQTNDEAILSYDPFAGDFGNCGDRVLSDKMVVAAKAHDECHICGGPIAKGERHRSRSEIFDDELNSFRWCALCCEAMATSQDDDGEAICARQDLHRDV